MALVALNSTAWVTLEEVKRHLDLLEQTKWDNLLAEMINSACDQFEEMIGRKVKSAARTEYYDGDGTNVLLVRNYPVTAITSIHDDVNRTFDAGSLIPSGDYEFDSEGRIGKIVRWRGGGFSVGSGNVKAVLTSGYTTVPGDIVRAAKLLVEKGWVQRGAAGLTSESTGSHSVSSDVRRELPTEVEAIADRYRRFYG